MTQATVVISPALKVFLIVLFVLSVGLSILTALIYLIYRGKEL